MIDLLKPVCMIAMGIAMLASAPAGATTCADLANTPLAHAQILSAQAIPAGSFTPPGQPTLTNLPAFCRVVGMSMPTPVSKIGFEVWLPIGAAYKDRYEQVGNGGFAGALDYVALAEGIRRGYATAATDDGHQGAQDPSFALNSPERIKDFGWRALKETTEKAKTLIKAFTGADPKFSYFFGCSDGGREALMEAQRFPDDFDGIVAEAPANLWTHQFTGFVWDVQAAYNHTAPFPALLPPAILPVLSVEIRRQCAGHDGGLGSDRFLTDPRACHINWWELQCGQGGAPPYCLSPAQIDAVKAIYAGPVNPATHKQIMPGFEPGAEDDPVDWAFWITGPSNFPPFPTFGEQAFFGEGFYADFVFGVPLLNLMSLNFTSDVAKADLLAPLLNSADPDLSAFRAHGGKLIQVQGWADSAAAPRNSIDYLESARATLGGISYADLGKFYRLFMAPGMAHCAGGPGANAFGNTGAAASQPPTVDAEHDALKALERWREMSIAPERIVATKYIADNPALGIAFQRPICPYPKLPRYDGAGLDPKKATSFSCS
jgi:hypothetical protein